MTVLETGASRAKKRTGWARGVVGEAAQQPTTPNLKPAERAAGTVGNQATPAAAHHALGDGEHPERGEGEGEDEALDPGGIAGGCAASPSQSF